MNEAQITRGFTSASALSFYAGVGSVEQKERVADNIRTIGEMVKFLMPSWDPRQPGFESQRYWCGPLWPQMNTIISKGLSEQGEADLAFRVRQDLASVIGQSGFRECFDPISGEGCIGTNFSWTAAMWLAWASPTREH